jgi:hypothetical protein
MAKENGVYSDIARFGRIIVTIKTIFWMIVFAIGLGIALYLIFKRDPHPNLTTGTIAEANCTQDGKMYDCKLRVNYVVDGKIYQVIDKISHTIPLRIGEQIQVVIAIMFLMTILFYWLFTRFQPLAALSGATTGLSLIGL